MQQNTCIGWWRGKVSDFKDNEKSQLISLKRNPIISQTDQNYSDVGVINQVLTLVEKGKLFPNIQISDEFAEQHMSQWRKFAGTHTESFPAIVDDTE